MRKTFLGELPRSDKGYIRWSKTIGYKVKFVYEDIEGFIEIVNYNKDKNELVIKYNSEEYNILNFNLIDCRLGYILGKINKDYLFDVGCIVDDVTSGELKILTHIRLPNGKDKTTKGYEYECLICGNKDKINEHSLKDRSGCNVCCVPSKKILIGFNDIHTVDSEFGKLFWNHEDGYKFTCNSNKKADFRCQNCGEKIKKKLINNVHRRGLSCSKCSDGISYPNKLMYNMLKQLDIEFETEYSPEWAVVTGRKIEKINRRRRYDFSSEELNSTIEMHGKQHYIESFKYTESRTLEDEQENDRLKEKLHKENSNREYIIIKADISELEYIKQNILNSRLAELIDLIDVDWEKADRDSQKSLVKIACDLWNSGLSSVEKIAQTIKISKSPVTKYLKRGASMGWCNYNANEESRKGRSNAGKKNAKSIVRLSLNGEFIDEYEGTCEAGRQIGVNQSNISEACRGGYEVAGGFMWMFKEDYEKNKDKIKPYARGNYKPVVRLTLDGRYLDEFVSTNSASRFVSLSDSTGTGSSTGTISAVCRGVRKSAYGFKWMFKEDYEKIL
jgi:predicted transcriptional regulator